MVPADGLRLETVRPDNVHAACALKVRPEQEFAVAPVAWSLAEAYVHGDKAWPRVIVDGSEVVGFVMLAFPPDGPIRCAIWRLSVAAERQRRGYGRFAVRAILAEAARRGIGRISVSWLPGPNGPERFYRGLGFEPTGTIVHGEVEAILEVPPAE